MAPRSLETLGDAWRARLQIFARCRNHLCRHEWLVDLQYVMKNVGADHFLEPVRGLRHFSERMRCPECGYVGCNVEHGDRMDMKPFFGKLHLQIEEWDSKAMQMSTIVAASSHIIVAHAAYESALQQYPRRRMLLRDGSFVVRDSLFRVIGGGKA